MPVHSVQLPELGGEVSSSFEHWTTPGSTIRDIVSWSYVGHMLVIFWLGYVGELVSPPSVQKSFNLASKLGEPYLVRMQRILVLGSMEVTQRHTIQVCVGVCDPHLPLQKT